MMTDKENSSGAHATDEDPMKSVGPRIVKGCCSFNRADGQCIKRDSSIGKFIDQKTSGKTIKASEKGKKDKKIK